MSRYQTIGTAVLGVTMLGIVASCQLFRSHPKKADVAFFTAIDNETPPFAQPTLIIGDERISSWRSLLIDLENYRPINRGIDNLLINDLYYYRRELVEKYHPKIVVLYLGEEELRIGEPLSKIIADYHRLLEKIIPWASVKIIIQSVIVSPQKRYLLPQIEELNSALEALAAQFPTVAFLNISRHFPDNVFQHDLNTLSDQGQHFWLKKLLTILPLPTPNQDQTIESPQDTTKSTP